MSGSARWIARALLLATLLVPAAAAAQDADPDEPTDAGDGAPEDSGSTEGSEAEAGEAEAGEGEGSTEPGSTEPGSTAPGIGPGELVLDGDGEALPPPTLEEGALEPEEPEEPPAILHHIGTGDSPVPPPPPEDDVPFAVPDDTRIQVVGGSLPSPPPAPVDEDGVTIEPEPEPTFTVAAGAGWTRVDGVSPVDLVRTEVRFEARIPDFPELRVGAGAAVMVGALSRGEAIVFEGGPRVSLAQIFHREGGTVFEITAAIQPGITAGLLGVEFDLHAGLTLRMRVDRIFELGVSGAYSLVGTRSLFHATGLLGLVF